MKAGWAIKRLKELATVSAGNPAPQDKSLFDGGIYPFFRTSDVGRVRIGRLSSSEDRLNSKGIHKLKLHKAGTILLPKSGASTYLDHRVVMEVDGYVSSHLATVFPDSNVVDGQFLFFALLTVSARELSADSSYPTLSLQQVQEIEITLPPLDEQRRIVEVLDKAFAGIATATANAQKNLTNARALFDGYLEAIFSQIDGSWETGKLAKIGGNVSTGPFGSLLHKSDYVENGIPLVNPAHIIGERIEPDHRKSISTKTLNRLSAYVLAENDIVIGRRGEIGRCAVVTQAETGWLCGTGCFFIRPKASVNAHFLAHLLRSRPYREALEAMATGATMLNLSNTALGELEIALPSLACQNDHVASLGEISTYVGKLQDIATAKLAALTELKQSLLQKAFAGELT